MITKRRTAFTLLELVFVIAVLGIVASIGSEIISKAYFSHIIQRAQYRSYMKVKIALDEIANRMRYAIPGTVVRRISKTSAPEPITTAPSTTNYNVLQWVGYDGDSFEAITSASNRLPGWSGFCDMYHPNTGPQQIVTPGSNLSLAQQIITNLGGNIANASIFFIGEGGASHGIASVSGNIITLDNNLTQVWERYKLAWSSYALSVENGDLYLYYNFPPVYGATLGQTKSLLLKNVATFKFKGSEAGIRVKLCVKTQYGNNASNDVIPACQEKVIF